MQLSVPLRLLFAAALLIGGDAVATEKYAIASDAKCVVVGRLVNAQQTRTPGGWDIAGEVLVQEVLFGEVERGSRMHYHFRCSCCIRSGAPYLDSTLRIVGVWFLLPEPQNRWTSAGSCSDPGWRPMGDRQSFVDFFKKRQEKKP